MGVCDEAAVQRPLQGLLLLVHQHPRGQGAWPGTLAVHCAEQVIRMSCHEYAYLYMLLLLIRGKVINEAGIRVSPSSAALASDVASRAGQ